MYVKVLSITAAPPSDFSVLINFGTKPILENRMQNCLNNFRYLTNMAFKFSRIEPSELLHFRKC